MIVAVYELAGEVKGVCDEPAQDHTSRAPFCATIKARMAMEAYILFAGDSNQGILYVCHALLETAMEEGWYAEMLSAQTRDELTQCLIAMSNIPLSPRPHIQPDVGVLANRFAADQLENSIKPGGLLIMNATQVRRPPRRHDIDIIMAPTEPEAEDPVRVSMTLLGTLIGLTGWVDPNHMARVLKKIDRDETWCKAFWRGYTYAIGLMRHPAETIHLSSEVMDV